jgi:hypothetical protein
MHFRQPFISIGLYPVLILRITVSTAGRRILSTAVPENGSAFLRAFIPLERQNGC